MDENKKKEEISVKLFSIIAHNDGFKVNKIDPDDGVDLMLTRSERVELPNGDIIMIDNEDAIAIQVKSVSERFISIRDNHVSYKLRVANYNKLVFERKRRKYIPYILILFIFPEAKEDWVSVEPESFLVRKNAFWFEPTENDQLITNKGKNDKIRIEIPLENKLVINTINEIKNGFEERFNFPHS